MSVNSGLPSDPHQWRIKHHVHTIKSPTRDLTLSREEKTGIGDNGSFETIETVESQIEGGIKITSHLQIAGQCDCGQYVTHQTLKFCICGKVLCPRCAERDMDENENGILCADCLKIAKRKRFWRAIWKIVTSPFIERLDE